MAFYEGNATEAARRAGYEGNDVTLAAVGSENLRKPLIAEAIKARETQRTRGHIATREERQAFWTKVLGDEKQNMLSRLKASELLGKSEADFVERHEHKGHVSISVINPYAVKPDDN